MAESEIRAKLVLNTQEAGRQLEGFKREASQKTGAGAGTPQGLATDPNAFFRSSAYWSREAREKRIRAEADAARRADAIAAAQARAGAAGGSMSMRGLSALSASGIPYISTLARAALAPLGVAAAAAAVSLLAFNRALENARSMYAKALQSGGMPLGFVTQRAQLARVLGVGEREVFQYGVAVERLSQKLAFSSKVLAETNPTVTETGWRLSVLKSNFSALFAVMAERAAPMVQKFADSLGYLVNKLTVGQQEANTAVQNKQRFDFLNQFASKYGLGVSMMTNPDDIAAGKLPRLYQSKAVTGRLTEKLAGPEVWKLFEKEWAAKMKESQAPPPSAWATRLQASPWERMGLVLGNIGNSPMQETAKNTRKMVTLMEKWNSPRTGSATVRAEPMYSRP